MIQTFKSKLAEDVFDGVCSRYSRKLGQNIKPAAVRKLDQINAATKIKSLRVPPNNKLEKLRGDLKEYWSIRVNNQYRIIFKWEEGNAFDVDIVDYH